MKQLNNRKIEQLDEVDNLEDQSESPARHQIHHHHPFFGVVFLVWGIASFVLISYAVALANIEIERSSAVSEINKPPQIIVQRVKPPAQIVKGIYLTAYSADSSSKMKEIINLIDTTELNAVVIDIKDYSGFVLYDSKLKLVNQLKTKDVHLHNPTELINLLHKHHIYVIARQTVMQDPVLAAAKPEWSVKSKKALARKSPSEGGLAPRSPSEEGWHDNKGLSWVDPSKEEVWNYNLAIAKEAIRFGFDEINFDYVRFPSDGNISDMVFAAGTEKKYDTMRRFYEYLSDGLKDQPAWISLDMFGLTMEATSTFDLNIGQRIIDATSSTDYISPMMYPSHYPPGHLGLKNPADNPATVFAYGLKLGTPKFVGTRAQLRPWIQAFNMGAIYDADKIRAQIDEIEKFSNAGWLMWNASNRYTEAGLKLESQNPS